MSSRTKKTIPQTPPVTESHFSTLVWNHAFWVIAATTAIAMPLLSLGYGIIWDEWIQSQYGKLVLKFLLTFGSDKTCLHFGETMYLYGGLFDTLCAFLYGLFFDSVKRVADYPLIADFTLPHWHDLRHVFNSLFGFTAILFTGLSARRIAGWRAGMLAFLFILLSPRFFGNAMNNPKDIPFAAAAALFIYFMLGLLREIPKPSRITLIGLAASIAFAINIKVGGILFLCYLWLFAGIQWLRAQISAPGTFPLSKLLSQLALVTLCGYFGGILFWPYGWTNPILHPIHALGAFSKFSGAQGKLLFDGIIYSHGTTPWYYLPKWILISSPLFLIFSFFIFTFTAKSLFKKLSPIQISFILFCALFPLVYAIAGKSIVYDAWRHFLFIYPPLVIICALVWNELIERADCLFKRNILVVILFFLFLEPLFWMIRWHPNEYIYFNPLVGGLHGAYGRYETDYWGNCFRPATEGFIGYYKSQHPPQPLVIRTDGEPISSAPFLVKGFGRFYTPYAAGRNQWAYSVEFSRSRNPEDLRNGTWPGPHTVYTVSADQIPLCAVIERKS